MFLDFPLTYYYQVYNIALDFSITIKPYYNRIQITAIKELLTEDSQKINQNSQCMHNLITIYLMLNHILNLQVHINKAQAVSLS